MSKLSAYIWNVIDETTLHKCYEVGIFLVKWYLLELCQQFEFSKFCKNCNLQLIQKKSVLICTKYRY